MLKRTKGYFLLTMLVLTGLAGRLHTDTLSGKERRFLISELKLTSSDFLLSIKYLTPRQLNYISKMELHPVKEYIFSLVSLERKYWNLAKSSITKGSQLQNEVSINDNELMELLEKNNNVQPVKAKLAGFKNTRLAIDLFETLSNEEVKYIRTATDNLRHHIIQTSIANIDTYQSILMICYIRKEYTKKIEKMKLTLNFPK